MDETLAQRVLCSAEQRAQAFQGTAELTDRNMVVTIEFPNIMNAANFVSYVKLDAEAAFLDDPSRFNKPVKVIFFVDDYARAHGLGA